MNTNFTQICFECGKYGHRVENCSQAFWQRTPTMGAGDQDEVALRAAEVEDHSSRKFGPWMLQSYIQRKVGKPGLVLVDR